MATIRHPSVDVVAIGAGWTAGILAAELCRAGMRVVALERGRARGERDFADDHDELRFAVRSELFQDAAVETQTLRHSTSEKALPLRYLGAWLPGTGEGGAGVHWNGQTWRFHPSDFVYRTHYIDKYGRDIFPTDMRQRDWGITYDTLEPYYTTFEDMSGISGQAGVIRGRRIPGGNPFEGSRSGNFPTRPMITSVAGEKFSTAARGLGYAPFPVPSANLSVPYTNPDGVSRNHCLYCGFCERFGCEVGAKGDPTVTVLPVAKRTGNFELRTHAWVHRIQHDGRRATGVLYTDAAGQTHEQPADIVLVTSFMFNNVRLLLLSRMGQPYDPRTERGSVGRNFAYQTFGASASGFFGDEDAFNIFMGSGANGIAIDEFNADNFNHRGLGFVGGGSISLASNGTRPIQNQHPAPDGSTWGLNWKRSIRDTFRRTTSIAAQSESPAYRQHFVDLDPTYNDGFGDPLLRVTFDWEPNERRMVAFLGNKIAPIMRAMRPTRMTAGPGMLPPHFDTVAYQSTHVTGGTIMGDDPTETVVNDFLQMWDFPNVFIIGASNFPQNAAFNPTGTVGALSYRAADGILNHYNRNPGPIRTG
ncbi:MAG TPA: GMC family oxidoreductase [Conexibacter sp.]|jgi:gluconate 2-dehydrogenase alpha chain